MNNDNGLDLITEALSKHERKLTEAFDASREEVKRIEERYKSLQDQVLHLAQKSTGHILEDPSAVGFSSAGAGARFRLYTKLFESPQMQALRGKQVLNTGKFELGGIGVKNLTSTVGSPGGSPSPATYDVQPQRDAGLYENPRRSLRLLDVLRRMPVNSNVFEFHRLSGYANLAAFQTSEGAPKQRTRVGAALERVQIPTIAHYEKASKQLLDDAPMLAAQLDDLLRFGVLSKFEAEIVNGNGVPGEIDGLLSVGTPFTPIAAYPADRISEAMSYMETLGWMASAVLLHPNDWHSIRTERGNDEQYVAGGWTSPAAPSVWNTPVVATPSLTEGTAIVLDGSQIMILDRMQPAVMVGQEGTDMTDNLVTLLAEIRAGLAIMSPTAVQVFSLAGSP